MDDEPFADAAAIELADGALGGLARLGLAGTVRYNGGCVTAEAEVARRLILDSTECTVALTDVGVEEAAIDGRCSDADDDLGRLIRAELIDVGSLLL